MSASRSTCPICAATFTADPTQEPAYRASLSGDDKAERERLLRAINAYWALKHHMSESHAEAMFVCGRQSEGPSGAGQPEAFWERDGTCSYCGSLSADQFFAAIEAGAEVGPTDKSYKVYLRGDGVPEVRGAAKFYFQHLDQAGQDRFIELFNAKRMKIGYPGHFYALPYFCVATKA